MKRKALVVWGGWEGHTPEQAVQIFIPSLDDAGFEVRVSPSLDVYADAQAMADLALVVQCWTMGRITPEQRDGLCRAVASGTGLAGWHGGIVDAFREDTSYQFMTGGQFVAHPGNAIPSYTIRIADRGHEITRGLSDFTMRNTEQYYLHADPGVQVLCTTTFTGAHGDAAQYPAGVTVPACYTRGWGRGRVFVATWGHTAADFDIPEAKEIVRRGLLWAARP